MESASLCVKGMGCSPAGSIHQERKPATQESVRVSLQLGRTAQGVYHACKFRQHSVASVLHDATAMLLDLRISQLAEMRLEPLVRPSSSAPISRQ